MATSLSHSNKTNSSQYLKKLGEIFGFEDEKILIIAILETSLEEININRRFADKIRTYYDALTLNKKITSQNKKKKQNEEFTPIKFFDNIEINPAKTADPFIMCEGYGIEQFTKMIQRYTKDQLLDNVKTIEDKKAPLKLNNKGKANKETLIAFILQNIS